MRTLVLNAGYEPLAVVSFNVGMEALMTLTAGAVYHFEQVGGWTTAGGLDSLLSLRGLLSVLVPAITLKAVNEVLMTVGSWLRGSSTVRTSRSSVVSVSWTSSDTLAETSPSRWS